MSWIRAKSSDQIRVSALDMARKKLAAGCEPCAEAYLELASACGATDSELAAIKAGPAASG